MEVLIADYHAPQEKHTESILAVLSKFGITNIKIQSNVFDAQLFFELQSIAPIGELERMTQYKSNPSFTQKTAQLLTYPILMAHDVANYDEIYVGEDQRQHLEYAKHLLARYNKHFGRSLKIPMEKVVGGRIKDLRSPEKKMSKSEPNGCLFLDDEPSLVRAKLKKATMDQLGTENIHFLYREFVDGNIPESNEQLKKELASAIIDKFRL